SPNGNTTDQIGVMPNLLTDNDYSAAVAYLLSSGSSGHAEGDTLRINLSWRWYVDLSLIDDETYRDAFCALLDAIPEGTGLYLQSPEDPDGVPVTKDELIQTYQLELENGDFSDIEQATYTHAIRVLQTYRLLNGFEDGTFLPSVSLRRSEFCQLIASALNLKVVAIENPYLDVPDDAWYTPAVLAMTNLGFVNGIGDGLFDPEGTVTHQQLITVMGRLAQFLNMGFFNAARQIPADELEAEGLTDYADWARPGAWLLSSSQTTLLGSPYNLLWDNTEEISPEEPATREETAYLFYELLSFCEILG
ncbi:MAG: S-layer homology domain-containing protein, partial [Oscillospiraceae bacterium]|nr:S-layer homology domain-containing protein [Oscillospiraceae bacterium]